MKNICPICGIPASEYMITETSTYCPGIEEKCGMLDEDGDEDEDEWEEYEEDEEVI